VVEDYEEAKDLEKHTTRVRRVVWRLKASEKAATYIGGKKDTAVTTRVRVVMGRDEK